MSLAARSRSVFRWLRARWRRVAAVGAALAIVGLAGGLLVAWSGLYNVAASRGHWRVTEWLLRFGLENSIAARAPTAAPPFDEDMARLGAGHFQQGCAFCHGAPGAPPNPAAQRMLPRPPDLRAKAPLWTDGELFWIVRHGLKYTGMPAWPARGRDEEVWAVAAFLRRLPDLDAEGYAALAGVSPGGTPGPPEAAACARCHGASDAPPSALVPTLQGQPRERLASALRAYREGMRDSGVMHVAAAGLTDASIERLAAHYAAMPAPERQPAVDAAARARGEALARSGDRARGVPACLGCHGPQALPFYPRLAGQPQRFLEGQLAAWREGLNDRSATGRIMAPIARQLTPEEAADLSAYFAGLPPQRQREAAR